MAARLAQLKKMPLELSNLENRVRAEVGAPPKDCCRRSWLKAHRVILGVALVVAAIVIVLLIAHRTSR